MSDLQADHTKALEEFTKALEELWEISGDFTPGSQQRWLAASRKANKCRDAVWYIEQKMYQAVDQKVEDPQ